MSRSVRFAAASPKSAYAAFLSVFLLFVPGAFADLTKLPTPYGPSWGAVAPKHVISLEFDTSSAKKNGETLRLTVLGLQPGDRLEVGAGTWVIDKLFSVGLTGSANAPIWIVAKPGTRPVITRSDNGQNVINIGSPPNGPARFVALQGFEITGGSVGLRIESDRTSGSTSVTFTT